MNTRRYEITDFEGSIIPPLLPNKPRGVPRADDRKALNGNLVVSFPGGTPISRNFILKYSILGI